MGTRELVPVVAKVPSPRHKDQLIMEQRRAACAVLRQQLRNWMQRMGLVREALCEAAEHIFAELLSNATKHAPELVAVAYRVEGDCLFLSVTDSAPDREPRPGSPNPRRLPMSGNGLRIAIAYAPDWGWTSDFKNGTKEVFFQIPLNI